MAKAHSPASFQLVMAPREDLAQMNLIALQIHSGEDGARGILICGHIEVYR